MMRLDDDSKLTGRWNINVFDEMHNKNAVYLPNGVDKDLEEWWPGTMKNETDHFRICKTEQYYGKAARNVT